MKMPEELKEQNKLISKLLEEVRFLIYQLKTPGNIATTDNN